MILIRKGPRLILYRVYKVSCPGNRPRTVLVARASATKCRKEGQPTPPPLVTGGGAITHLVLISPHLVRAMYITILHYKTLLTGLCRSRRRSAVLALSDMRSTVLYVQSRYLLLTRSVQLNLNVNNYAKFYM